MVEKIVINNQNGFALVMVLMFLVIIGLLGASGSTTSSIETLIASNDRWSRVNFDYAESAAKEAAQRLENETDSDNMRYSRSEHKWLVKGDREDDFVTDPTQWTNNLNDFLSNLNIPGQTTITAVATDQGVVKGKKAASLKMTSSSVYEYHLLGRSTHNNGQKIIEIGYKKRF